MNAYIVDGGEYGDLEEGYSRLVDIVIAPTRSRARYLFWQKYNRDLGDLLDGWCKHLRRVADVTGSTLPEGLLDPAHGQYAPLWEQSEGLLP